MKKIVITGANGFIGKNLLLAIPFATTFDRKHHDFFQLETLKALFTDADVIVHLAGVSTGAATAPSPESLIKNNLDVTHQLVKAIKLYCKTKPRVIFLSSIHVYDPTEKIITENSTIAPTSVYGVIKYSQELLLKEAAALGVLDLIIFRSTNIYGPETKPFYNSGVATMCFNAINGNFIELYGNGQARIDLIHISDVVTHICKSIELSDLVGVETFNLATGKTVTVAEVANHIENILNQHLERKFVSSAIRDFTIDISKLKKRFANSKNVNLLSGLKTQIQFMQKNIPLQSKMID